MNYKDIADQLASGKMGPIGAAGQSLEAARRALELPEPDRSLDAFAAPMGIDYAGGDGGMAPGGENTVKLMDPGFEPEDSKRIKAAMTQSGLSDQDAGSMVNMINDRDTMTSAGLDDLGEGFGNVAYDRGMSGDPNKMEAVKEIIRRLSSVPDGSDHMVTENPSVKKRMALPPTILEKLKREVEGPDIPESMIKNPLNAGPPPRRLQPRRIAGAGGYAPGAKREVGG